MFGELKMITEPTGKAFRFQSGQSVQVGRLSERNHFCVPDPFLAPVHFVIECTDARCIVRDATSRVQKHPRCEGGGCFLQDLRNAPCAEGFCRVHDMSGKMGLYLNGKKVNEADLANGNVLSAGSSSFLVSLSDAPFEPVAESPPPDAKLAPRLSPVQQDQVLTLLAQFRLPLYAITDAARDPRVRQLLLTHDALYYSLYDGPEGEKLDNVAPYLVSLEPGSTLARALVRDQWGNSSFSLLLSRDDFKSVRRHLRRFLMVDDERGKKMYFRFYDPRVLRTFLPTCTRPECQDFFGPIAWFIVESTEPAMAWVFSRDEAGVLSRREVPL